MGAFLGSIMMKYIPILHPAALMRDPSFWGVTVADLVRAKEEAHEEAYTPEPLDYVVIEDEAACRAALVRLLPTLGSVALDIETSGNRITCVGLCQQPPRVYVVPGELACARDGSFRRWATTATFLIHNAAFDVSRLEAAGITLGSYHDTMLLHHSIYSELPQSLAFVASVYTRLPYWKDLMKHEKIDEEK